MALPLGKCLVTGGAGFIGSHLVEALVEQGAESVTVLDDLSSGRLENLSVVKKHVNFIRGSINDGELIKCALKGVNHVFHLAALVAVPESIKQPEKCIDLNDLAVFQLYKLAAEAGVKRLIYSSSSAVYGEVDTPHAENLCPRPNTPYAMHKLLGEHYGIYFHQYHALESVYLRYFNVYGSRQLPDSPYSGVISLFIDNIINDRPSTIFDDGEQTRDFVYVKDVAQANIAAALQEGIAGTSFNIGSGEVCTINQLYALLCELAGKSGLKPNYLAPRAGDIRHSSGPTCLALKHMGFKAKTTLQQGLKATWDWAAGSKL